MDQAMRRTLAEIRGLPEIGGPDQTHALFFGNVPGEIRVILGNTSTGEQHELPNDGIVFIFPNKERIYNLVQDLGDCADFPESV